MSTSPDSGGSVPVQRLPPERTHECVRCHAHVHFVTRSSKPSADPHYRIVYLTCPVCGAPATMLREVGAVSRRRRYVYES